MLNDLSTFTRLSTFFQVLPFGVLIGGSTMAKMTGDLATFYVLAALVVVMIIGWAVAVVVTTRVASRSLHREIAQGSAEIVAEQVPAVVAPARLVRSRVRHRVRPWALGPLPGRETGTWSVTFTVLPPGEPPRRVGALLPLRLDRGTPALLALHPRLPEVGVIDLRATREQLVESQQDLRWATEELPTDRTVVGGYLMLVIVALSSLLTGVLIAGVLLATLP